MSYSKYSEMDFLFNPSSTVSSDIKKDSESNTRNIIKMSPTYTVYKNKKGYGGIDMIKEHYKSKIYSDQYKNPYSKIINNLSSHVALELKASDFAYLKHLGVYPINRMIVLRRFNSGTFVPEDLSTINIAPISRIVGWITDEQSFGSFTVSESWETGAERFDEVLREIVKKNLFGLDLGKLYPQPDFLQGALFEFYKEAGVLTRSVDDSVEEDYRFYGSGQDGQVGNTTDGNTWGLNNIPIGDPNVLRSSPLRVNDRQSINSSFEFEFESTYEQKLLGDVDPGQAMLDILDNIFSMGTSNQVFYWGDDSETIKKAKNASVNKANDVDAWWAFVTEITTTFWNKLTEMIINKIETVKAAAVAAKKQSNNVDVAIKNLEAKLEASKKNYDNPNLKNNKSSQDWNKKQMEDIPKQIEALRESKTTVQDQIMNALPDEKTLKIYLGSILTSTIGINRYRLRSSIELMVGGVDSSAPWHITIGNPETPWINTSHILVENVSVETSKELGFNDMPQFITAKFKCKQSRPLGKQEMMRMFNNSYRRTYSTPQGASVEKMLSDKIKNAKEEDAKTKKEWEKYSDIISPGQKKSQFAITQNPLEKPDFYGIETFKPLNIKGTDLTGIKGFDPNSLNKYIK